MKAKTESWTRIRFDLPEDCIRALRVRAVHEKVYPRDIVILALDRYLAENSKSTEAAGNPGIAGNGVNKES